MSAEILKIEGLRKSYGDVRAVDGISFSVREGSLFAFLGLNGAGKSTTIHILCTLLPKDGGRVTVAGADLDGDPDGVRRSVGVVFQNSVLDPVLTVRENLCARAAFYGICGARRRERISELAELLDLTEILDRRYGRLSGGQRRRADIARGLVHTPRILILDEPTTGLDPQTRKKVWEVVGELRRKQGMTVFLTTHYMEEATESDDVVILDAGRIAAQGTPVDLKNRFSSDRLRWYAPQTPENDALLAGLPVSHEGNCYRIEVENGDRAKELLRRFDAQMHDFEIVKGDMDDVFLNVTGKRLQGGNEG